MKTRREDGESGMDIKITKDLSNATLIVTSHFEAPVERIWQLWADPDELARWWGPPSYPTTITHHDLTPGGRVDYVMTGPEGDTHGGFWNVRVVEAPHTLEIEDGFTDADGKPNTDLPVAVMRVILAPDGDGTTMSSVTTYRSREDLETVLKMGMEEGLTESMSQIPAILAAQP